MQLTGAFVAKEAYVCALARIGIRSASGRLPLSRLAADAQGRWADQASPTDVVSLPVLRLA